MLPIALPAREWFDSQKGEFVSVEACTLKLEHSLSAISKWEAKWKKPFFYCDKTVEETYDYVKCMSLEEVDDLVIAGLTDKDIEKIDGYIHDPMTATKFSGPAGKAKRKVTTSEEIYFAMAANSIPFECERWHINRLLTLLRICSIHNSTKGNRMNRREQMSRQSALNDARRKKYGTSG